MIRMLHEYIGNEVEILFFSVCFYCILLCSQHFMTLKEKIRPIKIYSKL